MINNNWWTLWVRLMDTREIARIVTSSAARIDLPKWLLSEPYYACNYFQINPNCILVASFSTQISWLGAFVHALLLRVCLCVSQASLSDQCKLYDRSTSTSQTHSDLPLEHSSRKHMKQGKERKKSRFFYFQKKKRVLELCIGVPCSAVQSAVI